jgi:hypothetical protein
MQCFLSEARPPLPLPLLLLPLLPAPRPLLTCHVAGSLVVQWDTNPAFSSVAPMPSSVMETLAWLAASSDGTALTSVDASNTQAGTLFLLNVTAGASGTALIQLQPPGAVDTLAVTIGVRCPNALSRTPPHWCSSAAPLKCFPCASKCPRLCVCADVWVTSMFVCVHVRVRVCVCARAMHATHQVERLVAGRAYYFRAACNNLGDDMGPVVVTSPASVTPQPPVILGVTTPQGVLGTGGGFPVGVTGVQVGVVQRRHPCRSRTRHPCRSRTRHPSRSRAAPPS